MARPMTPADLDAFIARIERCNASPSSRDLHTDETRADALRAELEGMEQWVGAIDDAGGLLFDVAPDKGRAWGWGPAVEGPDREAHADALFDAVRALLPPEVTRLSMFPHEESWTTRWWLTRGAERGPVVHVYRAAAVPVDPPAAPVREPRASDRDALDALHAATFPSTYLDTDGMLTGERRRVFVADRGDGVVGYVCVEVQEDGGGYVHYLGVADRARRQGLGSVLLRAGLHWLVAQGVPDVHLTVSDTNHARVLYERAGFALAATGQTLDLHLTAS